MLQLTPHHPTPSARRLRAVALGASVLAVGLGVTACQPAATPPPERHIRICDTSVCLHAWDVIDSDLDGVSDADELMAGTDPHKAASRPPLADLIRLVADRKLPTYEYGRAFLQVMPAEIQAMREGGRTLPVDPALPATPDRGDTLSRLGIDTALLTDHGIDPTTDGFTLGLEPRTSDTQIPGPRVAGIDVRLISADDEELGQRPQDVDDPVPLEYTHGEVVEHINYGDWSSTKYADGAQTICSNAGGCKTFPPGSPDYYSNPDYDPGTVPGPDGLTPEQKKAIDRKRGAVLRTIEGWQPVAPDEPPKDPHATVILVDPDNPMTGGPGMAGVVFDAPRVTSAQPEVRPDLPSPMVPAPGGPSCTAGCGGADG